MKDNAEAAGRTTDVPAISAARTRLDDAVLGYNHHAILVERYRGTVERFRASRAAFEAMGAERTALRDARHAAAFHRDAVCVAVGDFVRLMRDAGMPPESALIAVKQRLALSVTVATPSAPGVDASLLETDATSWAIKAYFDAA